MNGQNNDRDKNLKIVLWLVLTAALVFWLTVAYQLVQIHHQYRGNLLSPRFTVNPHHPFTLIAATSTPPSPSAIEPWMTFDYINIVFKLSSTTLAQKLSITDPRYPYLSINHVATEKKQNANALTDEVRAEVRSALATSTPTGIPQ